MPPRPPKPGGPGDRLGSGAPRPGTPRPGSGAGFGSPFGRPAPPPPPGRPRPPMPPREPRPPRPPMPPRPPRHGNIAGDILIGGMLAGLGELLEESIDTLNTEDSQDTVFSSQSVKLPSECPFCGAPVVSSVCEYCGRNVALDN